MTYLKHLSVQLSSTPKKKKKNPSLPTSPDKKESHKAPINDVINKPLFSYNPAPFSPLISLLGHIFLNYIITFTTFLLLDSSKVN